MMVPIPVEMHDGVLELQPERQGPGFRLFRLLPRTTFDWTNVVSGGRLTYNLCAYVPLQDVPECLVVVRIHAADMAAGQQAQLVLQLVGWSADEPEQVFVSPTPLATVAIDSTAVPGTSVTARLRSDIGQYLRAVLHLDQASTPQVASVTLSVDLLARPVILLADEGDEWDEEDCGCDRA